MENILGKGLLLVVATTLVGTGIQQIGSNILLGAALLLAGAGVFILREYLKKKGYEVAGK